MKKINLDIEDIVHFYNFIFLIFLFYGSITPETDNLSRLDED